MKRPAPTSTTRLPSPVELDEAADRVTDAVIGLGAVSVLMMACVTFFVG